MRQLAGLAAFALGLAAAATGAEPIAIVAAESVYGDIARQIGGNRVTVDSILAGPDQDPHEFEAAAGTARALARARLVVFNGAGYDAWVERLLSMAPSGSRDVVEVARLVDKRAGDNPHLWYDVAAISAFAARLTSKLGDIDAANRTEYAARLAGFEASLRPLRDKIDAMRAAHAGAPVTATEPVFQYMADALGLAMRNERFQMAVMNGTEPGARTVAAFETSLRSRVVKALLFNAQTGEALAERMRRIAHEAGVPVVTITETLPPGTTYVQWMLAQLDALDRVLAAR
jgi:zinc/manganese transport system substrate-binding protein